MTRLKVMILNAENLFLLSDQKLTNDHLKLDEVQWQKLSTSVYENKPLGKAKTLARVIQELNPDLVLLCEVGGLESLTNFNRLFLQETYSPALVEGNSNRNIDIGYLIRKDLGFYFDLVSNKNRQIHYLYPHERDPLVTKGLQSHKFSRDVAELHFFQTDREKPFFIFFLTHLKSRLDPEGIDPGGFERRQAELKTLLQIYQESETKFAGKVPMALAGDFNGNAGPRQTDAEFASIYESTQLRDVCELAGCKEEESATYYQVGRSPRPEGKQIDYCFLSPLAQTYLVKKSVQVYRYKDSMGLPYDPPSTLEAKLLLPSDHYPLIFELEGIPVF